MTPANERAVLSALWQRPRAAPNRRRRAASALTRARHRSVGSTPDADDRRSLAGQSTPLALKLSRLCLEVDDVARQLIAQTDLDTETLIPGGILMLARAVDELETALVMAEGLDRRAFDRYIAANRIAAATVARAASPDEDRRR